MGQCSDVEDAGWKGADGGVVSQLPVPYEARTHAKPLATLSRLQTTITMYNSQYLETRKAKEDSVVGEGQLVEAKVSTDTNNTNLAQRLINGCKRGLT